MTSVKKSLVLSSVSTFGNLAISLGLVIVVSRLLPPAIVGSYVVAFSIILLLEPIRELQLQSYIVLQPAIDRAIVGRVQFLSLVLSLLAILAAGIAALIVYRSFAFATVGNCLLIMAGGFLFKAWATPAQGLLQRARNFRALALVTLGTGLAKVAITLALVFRGWGAEALAIGQFAEYALQSTALAAVERDLRWVRPRTDGTREILRFCSQFGGAQLAGQFSAALDGVLIGSFQGVAAAALYNRGNRIIRTFRSGIESAVLPIALTEFSAAREDRSLLREKYLLAVGALTGLSWPMLVAAIVLAGPLVLGLFGPEWGEAVYLAQILSIGAIIHAASALSQQLHGSAGEAALLLKRETYLSAFRIFLLMVTARISTAAVAYGFVLMLAVSFVVNQGLLRRSFGITAADFVRATWKSAIVSGAVGLAGGFALRWRAATMSDELALLVFGALCAGVWALGLFLVRHLLAEEVTRLVRNKWRAITLKRSMR